jgi:transposase
MMKPTKPTINISEEEFKALIQRVQASSMAEQDRTWLVSILETFRFLQKMLEQKRVAVHKLKLLLFGPKTEKDKQKPKPALKDPSKAPAATHTAPAELSLTATALTVVPVATAPAIPTWSSPEEGILDFLDPRPQSEAQPAIPGHGRRPPDSWPNAKPVHHCHDCLVSGQVCPLCKKGRLYDYYKPAVLTRIVGAPPLGVEIHTCDRLRCNACGALFTAPLPQEVQNFPVATPEANAVAVVTKYQAATPFHRFAKVLAGYGTPIPKSRLFDLCASVAVDALPVFTALCKFGAQGELFQNDDTRVKIQSLIQENKTAERAGIELKRKGMQMSSILAQVGEHRIALYFAGRKHAGENLAKILADRMSGLGPPTQVSDRLAANAPLGFEVDDGACLDHLRREFRDLLSFYPSSCRYVLNELKTIYRADHIAKTKKMNSSERLKLHQDVSLPVMQRLKVWGQSQLDQKEVEPNSPLGGAIRYLIKHFKALTLFTRKARVPIANSACEQSLKTPIAIRKLAYFFKTESGAEVACILLSLIQTCTYSGENIFEYLVAIQNHARAVRMTPEQWFPWNFRARLQELHVNLATAPTKSAAA